MRMSRGVMPILQIFDAAYGLLCAHAREAYPRECCGMLLGMQRADAQVVRMAVRRENAEAGSGTHRYAISPRALAEAHAMAARLGLQVLGFYHSHPDCTAQWSSADLAEAHWIGSSYLIVSVAKGAASDARSFLLKKDAEGEKRFVEQEICRLDGEVQLIDLPSRRRRLPGAVPHAPARG